jgi:hypothetical protein
MVSERSRADLGDERGERETERRRDPLEDAIVY